MVLQSMHMVIDASDFAFIFEKNSRSIRVPILRYDIHYKHIVHTTTGPTLFTDVFRSFYGMTGKIEYWISDKLLRCVLKKKLQTFPVHFSSYNL